jgi:type II secretory pathway pseudopilin PulG
MKQAGLTITEVLIAAFILVILLTIVGQGIRSSSSAVNTIVVESELLEDTRVAGQMIADAVARAVYIYPPGAVLTLNRTTGYTVENPITKNNVWRVGTDPILAFIEAPKEAAATNEACKNEQREKKSPYPNCAFFVAYYPVLRSTVVKKSEYGRYLEDKRNTDAWTLFEYRRSLANAQLEFKPPLAVTGGQGTMLADFIIPNEGFVPFTGERVCRNLVGETIINSEDASKPPVPVCEIFLKQNYNTTHLHVMNTLLTAQLEVQAQYLKQVGSSKTPRLTFAIAPRNLY